MKLSKAAGVDGAEAADWGKGGALLSDLMNRTGIPPFLTYELHVSTPAPKLVLIDLITALNSW